MPVRDAGGQPQTPLTDGQWQLVYPGVDLTFGDGDPYLITAPPELAAADPATQDQPQTTGDGTMFGRDTRPGQTLTFELGVNCFDEKTGMDAHGRLQAAWRGDRVRSTPQAVAELHARRGGRERLVYGRPRRFASVLAQIPQHGYSGATADFVCADDLWYDAAATRLVLTLAPPPSGGFTTPFVFPLTTTAASVRPGQLAIGGQVDTWPVVTIAGPVSRPRVVVTDVWTLELTATLAWDQTVTVDPRPWARTVLRSDGANLAGTLTRASVPLSGMQLPAATDTQVVFSGTDPTGSARCTVSYRNAWPHL